MKLKPLNLNLDKKFGSNCKAIIKNIFKDSTIELIKRNNYNFFNSVAIEYGAELGLMFPFDDLSHNEPLRFNQRKHEKNI